MRHPAIEVRHDELEKKVFISMHADGFINSNELRKAMEDSIYRMMGVPWWEEPVA